MGSLKVGRLCGAGESIQKSVDDGDNASGGSSVGTKIDDVGSISNSIDDLSKTSSNADEVVEELAKTNKVSANNAVTDLFKKFWSQHEFNVTRHLEKVFGRTNVGRQITIDIYIKGKGKITCRVDNLIRLNNGKFKIVDAKSSIVQNLSTKEAKSLATNFSTKNQKAFYEAIENETIEKITPRGQRAIDYFNQFTEFNNLVPENLKIEKSVDFYVNDTAEEGYNIFNLMFQ